MILAKTIKLMGSWKVGELEYEREGFCLHGLRDHAGTFYFLSICLD
jgi:hypothetical protein